MKNQFIITSSLVILIVISIFLSFFNLAKHPPQIWDEQTNIDVVNETLESCRTKPTECTTLKYQDGAFFEKPPLWYWATMGVTELLDANNTAYRLISALSGVGIALVTYYISKMLWGHWAGIVSGLSLLSIGHLFINNVSGYFSTHTLRSADLDALQILFIMLGILSYVIYKKKDQRILLHLTFAFSALAIMTKGPIGLLPIVILLFDHPNLIKNLSFLQNTKLKNSLRSLWQIIQKHHLTPFTIFLLIILPWHIWMYLKFGLNFINTYFLYHIVKRATETIEEHNEDFLFYIRMFWNPKVFAVGIATAIGIFGAIKKKLFPKKIGIKVALLGIMIPLTLFTLVPTKLAWYNLYIYPFAALTTGWLIQYLAKDKRILSLVLLATISIMIFFGIAQNLSWVISLS